MPFDEFFPKSPFPSWATNELYPDGVEPWAAAFIKVEPVTAVRAAGIVPDRQISGTTYNWLNNAYGALLRVLSHAPMQRWTAHAAGPDTGGLGGFATTNDLVAGAIVANCIGVPHDFTPTRGGFFITSPVAESSAYHYQVSNNGHHWARAAFGADPVGTPSDACGDIAGVVVVVSEGSTTIVRLTDPYDAAAWDTRIAYVNSDSLGFGMIYKDSKTNRLFAGIKGTSVALDNARIFTSDNSGAAWVARVFVDKDYTCKSIADNGKADPNTVHVAYCANAGGHDVILRSIDGGLTWSYVQDVSAGSPSGFGGVAYSPVYDQFMIVSCTDGKILNSSDGATWVTRSCPELIQQDTPATAHVISCIGQCFAMVFNAFTAGDTHVIPGVLYSYDMGEKWHWVPIGKTFTGGDFVHEFSGIKSTGSRFVVSSRGAIYVSGTMAVPPGDLTSV